MSFEEQPGEFEPTEEIPAPERADRPPARVPARTNVLGGDLDEGTADALRILEANRRARKRKRTIAVIIVAAILAAIAVALLVSNLGKGSGSPADDEDIPATTAVIRGDFESTVTGSGAARPLQMVSVTPEVAGIVETLNVTEGQVVNEGDVLLTLKNSDLDKAVNAAYNDVRSAESTLNASYTALDRAQANYNAALKAWNSAKTAEEQAEMTHPDIMWAEVEQAQIDVDSAQMSLDSARESYSETVAQANKRTITAPITGSVVSLNAEVGASWGSGEGVGEGGNGALLQIADISQMKVKLKINENDITKLSIGQTATVTFSALPDVELDATVTEIAAISSGIEEGMYDVGGVVTYDVMLLIPNPVPELKPGMTAQATIVSQSVKDTLLVPLSCIAMGGEGEPSYVTVVELDGNGRVTSSRPCAVNVLTKDNFEAAVEPTDGDTLEEGELVLLTGGAGYGDFVSGGDSAVFEDGSDDIDLYDDSFVVDSGAVVEAVDDKEDVGVIEAAAL